MKNRKIIILSEYFAPENAIGAVRMTKISKYLNANNQYKIITFANGKEFETIDELSKKDIEDRVEVVRFDKSKKIEGLKKLLDNAIGKKYKFRILNKVIKKIHNIINYLSSSFIEPRIFKYKVEKYIKKLDMSDCFAIISTYGPKSGHITAKSIKKKYPNVYWIADFRDPVLNIFTPSIFKHYTKSFAERITRKADLVVAVSNGYMEALNIDENKYKRVITNGYDREDLKSVGLCHTNKDKIIFSYTGNLYSGKRDLSIFLKVIRELINEKKIDDSYLEIWYAGKSFETLKAQSENYNLDYLLVNMGYVTRQKALELQCKSDVLLLATWNTLNGLGNIPGKFLEYMMIDKPIICITSGEIKESEVKKIIKASRIGLCYENGNKEVDYILLKKYILNLYQHKIEGEDSFLYNPNIQVIEKYNYENIAKQFESILSNIDKVEKIY